MRQQAAYIRVGGCTLQSAGQIVFSLLQGPQLQFNRTCKLQNPEPGGKELDKILSHDTGANKILFCKGNIGIQEAGFYMLWQRYFHSGQLALGT